MNEELLQKIYNGKLKFSEKGISYEKFKKDMLSDDPYLRNKVYESAKLKDKGITPEKFAQDLGYGAKPAAPAAAPTAAAPAAPKEYTPVKLAVNPRVGDERFDDVYSGYQNPVSAGAAGIQKEQKAAEMIAMDADPLKAGMSIYGDRLQSKIQDYGGDPDVAMADFEKLGLEEYANQAEVIIDRSNKRLKLAHQDKYAPEEVDRITESYLQAVARGDKKAASGILTAHKELLTDENASNIVQLRQKQQEASKLYQETEARHPGYKARQEKIKSAQKEKEEESTLSNIWNGDGIVRFAGRVMQMATFSPSMMAAGRDLVEYNPKPSEAEGASIPYYKQVTVDGKEYRVEYADKKGENISVIRDPETKKKLELPPTTQSKVESEADKVKNVKTGFNARAFLGQAEDMALDLVPTILITKGFGSAGKVVGASTNAAQKMGVITGSALQMRGQIYQEMLKHPELTSTEASLYSASISGLMGAVELYSPIEMGIVNGIMPSIVNKQVGRVLKKEITKKQLAWEISKEVANVLYKEPLEEHTQDLVEHLGKKFVDSRKEGIGQFDNEAPWENPNQMLETTLLSTVMGVFGGGAAVRKSRTGMVDAALNMAIEKPELVDNFLKDMEAGAKSRGSDAEIQKSLAEVERLRGRWENLKDNTEAFKRLPADKRAKLAALIVDANALEGDISRTTNPALVAPLTKEVDDVNRQIAELITGKAPADPAEAAPTETPGDTDGDNPPVDDGDEDVDLIRDNVTAIGGLVGDAEVTIDYFEKGQDVEHEDISGKITDIHKNSDGTTHSVEVTDGEGNVETIIVARKTPKEAGIKVISKKDPKDPPPPAAAGAAVEMETKTKPEPKAEEPAAEPKTDEPAAATVEDPEVAAELVKEQTKLKQKRDTALAELDEVKKYDPDFDAEESKKLINDQHESAMEKAETQARKNVIKKKRGMEVKRLENIQKSTGVDMTASIGRVHKKYDDQLDKLETKTNPDAKAPVKREEITTGLESQRDEEKFPTKDFDKNENFKAIKEKYSKSDKKATGKTVSRTLPNGEKITGKYVLINKNDIAASHLPGSFTKTPGVPVTPDGKTFNDNDYEKSDTAQQVQTQIATNYDSRAIDDLVFVDKNGIVKSGNGRTISRQMASAKNAKAYIEALKERADEFGFTPKQIEAIGDENVMLIVEMEGDPVYNTKEYSKFNASDKKAKTPLQEAIRASKSINEKTVNLLAAVLDEADKMSELSIAELGRIRNILINADIISELDQAQYFDENGKLTTAGTEFVENLILASVFNENELRMLASLPTLRQTLASNRVRIFRNSKKNLLNIVPKIRQAIYMISNARQFEGTHSAKIYQSIAQGSIFDQTEVDAEVVFMALLMNNAKHFASTLNQLNNTEEGADIFGNRISSPEIISHVLDKFKPEINEEGIRLLNLARSIQETQGRNSPSAKDSGNDQLDASGNQEGGKGDTPSVKGKTETPAPEKQDVTAPELTDGFTKADGNTVVDENGNPLVLYHGTDRAIPKFTQTGSKQNHRDSAIDGMWFTDSKDNAQSFTFKRYEDDTSSPTVVSVHIKLTNPLIVDLNDKKTIERLVENQYGKDEWISHYKPKYEKENWNNVPRSLLEKAISKELKNNKYDGIVYKGFKDKILSDNYLVFDENNIKVIGSDNIQDKAKPKPKAKTKSTSEPIPDLLGRYPDENGVYNNGTAKIRELPPTKEKGSIKDGSEAAIYTLQLSNGKWIATYSFEDSNGGAYGYPALKADQTFESENDATIWAATQIIKNTNRDRVATWGKHVAKQLGVTIEEQAPADIPAPVEPAPKPVKVNDQSPEEVMRMLADKVPSLAGLMNEALSIEQALRKIQEKAGLAGQYIPGELRPALEIPFPFVHRLYSQYVTSRKSTPEKREDALQDFEKALEKARDFLANVPTDEELATLKKEAQEKADAKTAKIKETQADAKARIQALNDLKDKEADFISSVAPNDQQTVAMLLSKGVSKDQIRMIAEASEVIRKVDGDERADFYKIADILSKFNYDLRKLIAVYEKKMSGNLVFAARAADLVPELTKIADKYDAIEEYEAEQPEGVVFTSARRAFDSAQAGDRFLLDRGGVQSVVIAFDGKFVEQDDISLPANKQRRHDPTKLDNTSKRGLTLTGLLTPRGNTQNPEDIAAMKDLGYDDQQMASFSAQEVRLILSHHFNFGRPVAPAPPTIDLVAATTPRPKADTKPAKEVKRKIRDQKAKDEIDDAWKDFLKGDDLLTVGGLDPKRIEAGVKLISLYTKQGIYKFSDIIEDAYAKLGDKLEDYFDALKSVYSTLREHKDTDDDVSEQMDQSLKKFTYPEMIGAIKAKIESENEESTTPEDEDTDINDAEEGTDADTDVIISNTKDAIEEANAAGTVEEIEASLDALEKAIEQASSKIGQLVATYSTEGIQHETPNVVIGKQAKKDITKHAKEIARLTGWVVDKVYPNIAPAGGEVYVVFSIPGTSLKAKVSLNYEPDYSSSTGYDNYTLNRVFYRIEDEKNKKSLSGNRSPILDYTAKDIALALFKSAKKHMAEQLDAPVSIPESIQEASTTLLPLIAQNRPETPNLVPQSKTNGKGKSKSGGKRNGPHSPKLDRPYPNFQQGLLFGPEEPQLAGKDSDPGGEQILPEIGGTGSDRPVSTGGSGGSGTNVLVSNGGITVQVPAKNYHFPNDYKDPTTFNTRGRFESNLDALKLLKTLLEESRPATPEEQEVLVKYVGWGGIKAVLNSQNTTWSKADEALRPLVKELHEIIPELEALLNTKDILGSIRNSALNAHYTGIEVIRSIYSIVHRLGFPGGRVLEPSAGIGHFLGSMPGLMAGNSKLFAIEKEPLTGAILSKLYPKSIAATKGYETAQFPNNHFDLAISNIPFGDIPVGTERKASSILKKAASRIHNFFFVRALDQVKEGGLIAFITSSATLDTKGNDFVREHLDKNTDFLGAIRLPNTAFKGVADTSVVTDIIFLRKNTTGDKQNPPFLNLVPMEVPHKDSGNLVSIAVNEYFINNPDHVIGKFAAGGLHARNDMTVIAEKGTDVAAEILKLEENFPEQVFNPQNTTEESELDEDTPDEQAHTTEDRTYYIDENGKPSINVEGEPTIIPKAHQDKVPLYIALRDALKKQYALELSPYSEEKDVEDNRKLLNKAYDNYVKKFKYLHQSRKFVLGDQFGDNLIGLENYDKETKTTTKADIFKKRNLNRIRLAETAESMEDAIGISTNETGRVDIGRIAQLLGIDVEAAFDQGYGQFFQEADGRLVTKSEYLSGNVKKKLKQAEELAKTDPLFQQNVDALLPVIPKDLNHFEIEVPLGARWVPTDIYRDFVNQLFGVTNASVSYSGATDQYSVDGPDTVETKAKYGVLDKRSGYDLMEAAMHGQIPVIRKTISLNPRKEVVDTEATEQAREKYDIITAAFNDWLWKDDQRQERLTRIYNDKYNTTIKRQVDGTNLHIDGLNKIVLKQHQKDAIMMIFLNQGGIIDHEVGLGKTYVMIGAAMKMKQTGVANKPTIVALKSTIPHIVHDAKKAFPTARILAPTVKDFQKENRKALLARIQNNDWDLIIMSHDQFKFIPQDPEFQSQIIQEEIDQIRAEIELMMQERGGKEDKKLKIRLEKRIEKLKIKLNDIQQNMAKDKDLLTFKEMGIDHLFVDESQQFKNLTYTTRINDVAGLGDPSGSDRAFNMLAAIRSLQAMHGGDKGTTFLSGTPISNSLVEMYLLLKYLRPEKMKEIGYSTFDSWVRNSANQSNELEFTVMGTVKSKNRFREFINIPELSILYTEIADVRNADNTPIDRPTIKGGKPELITVEQSKEQKRMTRKLIKFAKQPHGDRDGNLLGIGPLTEGQQQSAMLLVTGISTKLAVDIRLVDPTAKFNPNGKLNAVAKKVAEDYNASSDTKGTQLIFSDIGTPKTGKVKEDLRDYMADQMNIGPDELNLIFGPPEKPKSLNINQLKKALIDVMEYSENQVEEILEASKRESQTSFNAYDEMKRLLIDKGIPADEIVFIHSYKTDDQRKNLYNDVNSGKIRVVIGSTQKLGTGVNVQERLVSIHHIDAPWTPAAMTQRNGRGIRQGNTNKEVAIYQYGTVQTLDTYKYQLLAAKQKFIDQVKIGASGQRIYSDKDGNDLSAQEIVAVLSGNPLLLESAQNIVNIEKLKRAKKSFDAEQYDVSRNIKYAKKGAEDSVTDIAEKEADYAVVKKNSTVTKDENGDEKLIPTEVIEGKTPKDSKERTAMMAKITARMEFKAGQMAVNENGKRKTNREVEIYKEKVGNVSGLDLMVYIEPDGWGPDPANLKINYYLKGKQFYPTSPSSFSPAINRIPDEIIRMQDKLEVQRKNITKYEALITGDWPRAQELADLIKKQEITLDKLGADNSLEKILGVDEDTARAMSLIFHSPQSAQEKQKEFEQYLISSHYRGVDTAIEGLEDKYEDFTPEGTTEELTAWGKDIMAKKTEGQEPQLDDAGNPVKIKIGMEDIVFPERGTPAFSIQPDDQIYSPEFKNWFGDWENDPANASKVVDKDGKPMIVYHGTPNGRFNTFDAEQRGTGADIDGFGDFGNGFYFTPNEGAAKGYAEGIASRDSKDTPYVFGVYLNMRKPFDLGKLADYQTELLRLAAESQFTVMNAPPEIFDKALKKAGLTKEEHEFMSDIEGTINDNWGDFDVQSMIAEKGYDGIIDYAHKEYVVFSPNQIKSATDNTGSFDPGNPDIRFSVQEAEKVGNPDPNAGILIRLKDANATEADLLPKFANIWLDLIKGQHEAFYKRGLELIKGTPYEAMAAGTPGGQQAELHRALAEAIADKVAKIKKTHDLIDWVKGFWKRVGKVLRLNVNEAELENMTIGQYTDIAAAQLRFHNDIYAGLQQDGSNPPPDVQQPPSSGAEAAAKKKAAKRTTEQVFEDYIKNTPPPKAPSESDFDESYNVTEQQGAEYDARNRDAKGEVFKDGTGNQAERFLRGYAGKKRQLVESLILVMPTLKKAGIDIVMHENPDSYYNAVTENNGTVSQAVNSGGFYANKQVHINISKPNLKANTALHEAMHPVIADLVVKNKPVFQKFVNEILSDPYLREKYYTNFALKYYGHLTAEARDEEALVEYSADIILERILRNLNKIPDSLFDRLLTYIREALGDAYGQLAKFINTKDDVKSFASSMASAISKGMVIPIDNVTKDAIRTTVKGSIQYGKIKQKSQSSGKQIQQGQHTNIVAMKAAPGYKAAKRGNAESAAALVDKLYKPNKASILTTHPNALIVPVVGVEAEGVNAIPEALAFAISSEYGNQVDDQIFMANKPFHTGANMVNRLLNVPLFEGQVVFGQDYFLVDDVSTTGSTLQALRLYIESKGGNVIGMNVLGAMPSAGYGQLSTLQEKILNAKFGQDLLKLLRTHGIANEYTDLTGAQAQYFIERINSLDTLRKRIAEEYAGEAESRAEEVQFQYRTRPGVLTPQFSTQESDNHLEERNRLKAMLSYHILTNPSADYEAIAAKLIAAGHLTKPETDTILNGWRQAKERKLNEDQTLDAIQNMAELLHLQRFDDEAAMQVNNENLKMIVESELNEEIGEMLNRYSPYKVKEMVEYVTASGAAHPNKVLDDLTVLNGLKAAAGVETTIGISIALYEMKQAKKHYEDLFRKTGSPDAQHQIQYLDDMVFRLASAAVTNGSYAGAALGVRSKLLELAGLTYQSQIIQLEKINKHGKKAIQVEEEHKEEIKKLVEEINALQDAMTKVLKKVNPKTQKVAAAAEEYTRRVSSSLEQRPKMTKEQALAHLNKVLGVKASFSLALSVMPPSGPTYYDIINELVKIAHEEGYKGFKQVVGRVMSYDSRIKEEDIYNAILTTTPMARDQALSEYARRQGLTKRHVKAIGTLEKMITTSASNFLKAESAPSETEVNDVGRLLDEIEKNVYALDTSHELATQWLNALDEIRVSYEIAFLNPTPDKSTEHMLTKIRNAVRMLSDQKTHEWMETTNKRLNEELALIKAGKVSELIDQDVAKYRTYPTEMTVPIIDPDGNLVPEYDAEGNQIGFKSHSVKTPFYDELSDKRYTFGAMDRLIQDKKKEIEAIKNKYRARMNPWKYAWKKLRGTVGSSLAMADLSYFAIQGYRAMASIGTRDPKMFFQSFWKSIKAMMNEFSKNPSLANDIQRQIMETPYYDRLVSLGLVIMAPDANVFVNEHLSSDDWFDDAFDATKGKKNYIAKGINKGLGFRKKLKMASNAAFATHLNLIAINAASSYIEGVKKDTGGRMPSDQELIALVRDINNSTGRSNLAPKFTKGAAEVLWAPKLYLSQLLNIGNIVVDPTMAIAHSIKGNKEMARVYKHRSSNSLRFAAMTAALWFLRKKLAEWQCGDEAGYGEDSNKSSWLKITCGEFTFDPTGNHRQWVAFGVRLYNTILNQGPVDIIKRPIAALDQTLGQFKYKLAPHVSFVLNLTFGSDFLGRKKVPGDELGSRLNVLRDSLIPIYGQNVKAIVGSYESEQEIKWRPALAIEAILGSGMNFISEMESEKWKELNKVETDKRKLIENSKAKIEFEEKYGKIPELQGDFVTPVKWDEIEPTNKRHREEGGTYKLFRYIKDTNEDDKENDFFVVRTIKSGPNKGKKERDGGKKYHQYGEK